MLNGSHHMQADGVIHKLTWVSGMTRTLCGRETVELDRRDPQAGVPTKLVLGVPSCCLCSTLDWNGR